MTGQQVLTAAVIATMVLLPVGPALADAPVPPQDVATGIPLPTDSAGELKTIYLDVTILPSAARNNNGGFGVGQLVTVDFPVAVNRKADVEAALKVSGSKPLPPGSWGWIDDDTVVYRPRQFWPAGTTVTFDLALRDVILRREGDRAYLGEDRTYQLRTGRSFVLRIDARTDRLKAYRNHRLIRTAKVSLGKRGFETRSGIKVLTGEKHRLLKMTGRDRKTGESWQALSPYSIRLTPTGEFLHGAPWAYGRLGRWNGSHGCTNLFVNDARWLYKRVRAGDPVITSGTGRRLQMWNGTPGTYWNYSDAQWGAKSSL